MRLRRFLFFSLFANFIFSFSLFAQQKAVDSLKHLIDAAKDTSRISLLIKLSETYLTFAPRKAMVPAEEARLLATQSGHDLQVAQASRILGMASFRSANYKEAIINYDSAFRVYNRLHLYTKTANLASLKCDVYISQGNYDTALIASLDAYKISERLSDKAGMANALLGSGRVYRAMKKFNNAVTDFQNAFNISKDINDVSIEGSALINISNIYSDNGDYDKAISSLQQAYDIYQAKDDKMNMGTVLNNIGAVYLDINKNDEAETYLNRALDIRTQINDTRGILTTLYDLGAVNTNNDKPDKALDYYNRALVISRKTHVPEMEMNIYEAMSETWKNKNDFSKALDCYTLYAQVKDSIFDDNLSESIAEMQAKYDVEKAENDARVQKANADAEQQQKKIIVIASGGGGVLLIVIVVILWNRAVTRKRVNIRLNQQKNEIEQKNTALTAAKQEIELKNKDITDSIRYARRIQEAILPEVEFTKTFGEKGFVFYRPKDIVSGDFYWMSQKDEFIFFAAVDCTGHGVPGAFVSIVCSNLLSQAVNEHQLRDPALILDDVNARLSETLRQREDESRVRDGMDIALCCVNKTTKLLSFAGAFNPAWVLHGKEFTELKPDKFPVGLFVEEEVRKFSRREMQLFAGDRVYVFSDGYSDQFGGADGKKYKRSAFCDFIKKIQHLPVLKHRTLLEEEFLRWKGSSEQVDDVLVMGIEV